MLEGLPTIPGGGDGWWDRYGAIGAVAFVSISALGLSIRQFFLDRRLDKAHHQALIDQQQQAIAALNAKLVELVRVNHTETLALLDKQRQEHEDRYEQLLDRHIATADSAREKTLELAAAVTKAIQSLSRKLGPGEGRPHDRST